MAYSLLRYGSSPVNRRSPIALGRASTASCMSPQSRFSTSRTRGNPTLICALSSYHQSRHHSDRSADASLSRTSSQTRRLAVRALANVRATREVSRHSSNASLLCEQLGDAVAVVLRCSNVAIIIIDRIEKAIDAVNHVMMVVRKRGLRRPSCCRTRRRGPQDQR